MKKLSGGTLYFLFFLSFVFLFLVSAFRDGLGTDFYYYEANYENINSERGEILFRFLFIYFLRIFSSNALFFFIVSSFLINYLFLRKIYLDSYNPILSLIIYIAYFYLSTYNIIRQFIVFALFYSFAIKLLENRSKWFFAICIGLSMIHLTCIALFPLYFINNKTLKAKSYLWIWGGSLFLLFAQVFKLISISDFSEIVASLSFISNKFETWGKVMHSLYRDVQSNIQLYLKNVMFVLIFIRLSNKKIKESYVYLNILFYTLLLQNIFSSVEFLGVRMGYYGDVAFLFLIPLYVKSIKIKINKQIAIIGFLIYFVGLGFYRFYLKGESQALPKWKPDKEIMLYRRYLNEQSREKNSDQD